MLTVEMLSEPVVVPDTYATGLAHAEPLGDGLFRFTFFATRQSIHGGTEHTVEVRLILSLPAIYAAIKMTLRAIGAKCCGAGVGRDRTH